MPVSKESSPATNREGNNPFDPPDDILKPVEAYWRMIDFVVDAAARRGLLVAMSALWIQWGGHDAEGWRNLLNESNARSYGEFLGKRYRNAQNLIWIVGGDDNPYERTRAIAELARGIHEFAPHQLITVHNHPGFASAAFFDSEPWLGIDLCYTYEEVYRHVLGEYNRLGKIRPIILGESGYELENNDERGGSPYRVRRQAYEAILNGALGGHAYGHRDIWKITDRWRQALDDPADKQMAYVQDLFATRRWYDLEPDQNNRLVAGGKGYWGDVDWASAARTADGTLAIIYLPRSRKIRLDLGLMRGTVRGQWLDPSSGRYGPALIPKEGATDFTPPEKNAGGDPDFVLLLEASQ